MSRLFLEAIMVLTWFFAIASGRQTSSSRGDPAPGYWDRNRFAPIFTPEWQHHVKVSKARYQKRLGFDDPDVDPSELARRELAFVECLIDEIDHYRMEGANGPHAADYLFLPWGEENRERFMPIEDHCVGEATDDPRMAESRARRQEFRSKKLQWQRRAAPRRWRRLPPDPNDPEPQLAPQAPPILEMR